MSNKWEEKRKYPRTDALWDVMEDGEHLGILVDISPNGANIWSSNERNKKLGDQLQIHIRGPAKMNYKDVQLMAEVKWIKEDEDNMYFIGLEFLSLSDQNRVELDELIKFFDF